jgi:hypothetical protein
MRHDYLTTADRDRLRTNPGPAGEQPTGFRVQDSPERIEMIAVLARISNLRKWLAQHQGGFVSPDLAGQDVAALEAELADLESRREAVVAAAAATY